MLGEAQWQWLEKELGRKDIKLFIIGNGTQIIPDKYPYEKWANFPKSRNRLFNLLQKNQDKKFILLSGDLHTGEISRITPEGFSSPLYEHTSSGLTHYFIKIPKNKYRKGRPAKKINFGLIEIVWNEQPVKVKLQIIGMKNKIITEKVISLE